jgi:ABC-type multidrug transport system fused ATPase/permease subunit
VIKKCVLTMMACVCLQIVAAVMLQKSASEILFAPLNLVINTIVGIFLLRDDPQIAQIYELLAKTCCSWCSEQCGGGMSCLVSFIACNLIMVVFDVLLNNIIGVFIAGFKTLSDGAQQWPNQYYGFAFALYMVAKLGAFVAEILGSWQGYKAYREAQSSGVTGSGGDWGRSTGTPLRGGTMQLAREQPDAPARESRPAPEFQPFSGGGNRLGSGA